MDSDPIQAAALDALARQYPGFPWHEMPPDQAALLAKIFIRLDERMERYKKLIAERTPPGINPLIYLRQRELERLFEETADDTRPW